VFFMNVDRQQRGSHFFYDENVVRLACDHGVIRNISV